MSPPVHSSDRRGVALPAAHSRRRRIALRRNLVALIALPLLLLACGQGTAQAPPPAGPSAGTGTAGASVGRAPAGPSLTGRDSYEVKAASVGKLGTVLVNGAGLTLYMFEPDQQGTPTCVGICATEWPPVLLPRGVTAPKAGPGIQASLLGTVKRPDGTLQVTYAKWPLYRWNADAKPGQATGQGLYNWKGRWYVMDPSGKVLATLP